MESNSLQRQHKQNMLLAIFLIAAGVAAVTVNLVYYKEEILMLLGLAGLAMLGAGLWLLLSSIGLKKLMDSLGVDEASMEQFEREKKAGCGKVGYGQIILTVNWLFFDSLYNRQALLPLGEVVFYEKGYRSVHYGADFYMSLVFKGGGKYRLKCEFEQQDKIIALLKERCPQASEREGERLF